MMKNLILFFIILLFHIGQSYANESRTIEETLNSFRVIIEEANSMDPDFVKIKEFKAVGGGVRVCNPLSVDCSIGSYQAYALIEYEHGIYHHFCTAWVDRNFNILKQYGYACLVFEPN